QRPHRHVLWRRGLAVAFKLDNTKSTSVTVTHEFVVLRTARPADSLLKHGRPAHPVHRHFLTNHLRGRIFVRRCDLAGKPYWSPWHCPSPLLPPPTRRSASRTSPRRSGRQTTPRSRPRPARTPSWG